MVGVSSETLSSVHSLPRELDAVFDDDGVSLLASVREYVRYEARRELADLCPGCAIDRSVYTASIARTEPGRLQEALGVPIQRYAVAVSQDCFP